MKRKPILLPLLSCALLLAGCATKEGGSSPSSISDAPASESAENSGSEGPSSSFDGDFDLWDKQQQELMMTYCGTLLPHPFDLIVGPMEMEEQTEGGESCLVLYNFSESWTIKDYHKMLERFGWTAIKDYKGDVVQKKGLTSYVEMTRSGDNGSAYELMYYHVDASALGGDSYNCIVCCNSYVSGKTEKKEWDEKEKEAIEYATSTSLPFFALGSNYSYSASSETEIDFYDYCSEDLSQGILSSLEGDGYRFDEAKSEEYAAYYLAKILSNGAKVEILVSYLRGNNVYVYFTPAMEESPSWPSAFLVEAEEELGHGIPSFKIAKGGVYKTYELHGASYIVTYDLDSSYDYYSYIDEVNSELFSWEERLVVSSYLLVDESEEPSGFLLRFQKSEPTSLFSSSWPSEAIEKGIKDSLGAEGVEIPAIDLSSYSLAKDMKYRVVTPEDYEEVYQYYLGLYIENYGDVYSLSALESMAKSYADRILTQGVTLCFYDSTLDAPIDFVVRYKINEAYKDLLYRSGWYLVPDTGSTAYEDPTGQIRIDVSNEPYDEHGYTSIAISEGSGEVHTPSLSFRQSSYEAGTGVSFTPILDVSMLPYEVTYSCSDATGKVAIDPSTGKISVAVDAAIGYNCQIYATCVDSEGKTHMASAEIKVVKGVNYVTNLEEVEELLKAKGYTDFAEENLYAIGSATDVKGKKLTLNFGKSLSKQEVKDLVESSFVPKSFVSSLWSKEDEDAYSSPSLGGAQASFAKKGNYKKAADTEYLYCFRIEDYASFSLTYYVFTDSNGDIILEVESRRYR